MVKLSVHLTDKQFVTLAHQMHTLLHRDYVQSTRIKGMTPDILNARIQAYILWEMYLKIAKRCIMKKSKYLLVVSDIEGMAFFCYFNPKIEQMDIYEGAIFQLICDKMHKRLV